MTRYGDDMTAATIRDIMVLVARYNTGLVDGEDEITFTEMAALMGYERDANEGN